jgi:pimeloyl-ACP methyl ester carboxylesterase
MFLQQGIPAYTFDYRGYGNSTGWPSEERLKSDSVAIWKHIQRETGVSPENAIVLGNSLGSGIASHLAKTIQPKALILIAPYASIPAVVRSRIVYRPFEWVLRYNLSVVDDLRALTRGEVIVAHGKADGVIPFDNFTQIVETLSHNREVKVTPLVSETAGHNEIYYAVEDELVSALKKASGLVLYPTP